MRWLTCAMLPVALAATIPLVSTPDSTFVADRATVGTGSGSDMDDLTPISAIPDIRILEHDAESAYAKFEVGGLPDELTAPLVLDFRISRQSNTPDGPDVTGISLNGAVLDLTWGRPPPTPEVGAVVLNVTAGSLLPAPSPLAEHSFSSHTLSLPDQFGFIRRVEIGIRGRVSLLPSESAVEQAHQVLNFTIIAVDGIPLHPQLEFTIVARVSPFHDAQPPYHPVLEAVAPLVDIQELFSPAMTLPEGSPTSEPEAAIPRPVTVAVVDNDEAFELESEIQALMALEQQAQALQADIAARKQRIGGRLRQHRESAPLKHLLAQCDGLLCAARVIAQRICDKVGIATEPSFQYSRIGNLQQQPLATTSDSAADEKAALGANYAIADQIGVTKLSSGDSSPPPYSLGTASIATATTTSAALITILEIFAAALGLGALLRLLHQRCMSPRTRAERAADREERRNARAYRRAARRAWWHTRWARFCAALTGCFGCGASSVAESDSSQLEAATPSRRTSRRHYSRRNAPRMEDYEEKRALILQDAFLEACEADPERAMAEKGQVMEAEIRELRHAHEIVRGLVGSTSTGGSDPARTTLPSGQLHRLRTMHRYDPPPALVPLPRGVDGDDDDLDRLLENDSDGDEINTAALTPVSSRSRASSGTLPSYSSEAPPDYVSRPDVDAEQYRQRHYWQRAHQSSNPYRSASPVFGLEQYFSDEEDTRSESSSLSSSQPPSSSAQASSGYRRGAGMFSPQTNSCRATRSTPSSSVIDTSPRPSAETLRMSLSVGRCSIGDGHP